MNTPLFHEFLISSDTLRVYEGEHLLFTSEKDGLLPLLEYIDWLASRHHSVGIFDRIMGNAAALLSIKAACHEVYSPLGSRLAVRTLDRYGIKHYLSQVVPYIEKPGGEDMCPMERLSLDKDPDEFYMAMKALGRSSSEAP